MKIVYRLLALASLLLAHDVYALDPAGQPAMAQGSDNSEISCPAADFSTFADKFSNDENIQRAFTNYPLVKQQLDPDAEPEPKRIVRKLRRDQVRFPIIPLREERAKRSLQIRIDSVTVSNGKVTLIKPDTDYQVSYFFKKRGCWRLERVEDWSL